LHLDIIQANEHSEEVDLKWKAANRQLQNESRDLRFLVESKDAKIRALDREIAKMRGKLEKTLAKMYMPSQDEVVEGLAGDILERGELNVMAKAGGHQQEFELNHPVNNPNDMSDGGLIAAGMDDKL
jgi:DNA repair exonuclease SbcCD ATPase subunit